MRLSSKPLALLLSLLCAGAAQAGGKLGLANVRPTYGINGPTRPDNKYLPGDRLDLSFDITNITVDRKSGQAKWEMAMDVIDDAKGKSVFNRKNPPNEMLVALGGNRLPAYCYVSMGLDQPAGKYTLRVTVTDLANKATTSTDYKFVVGEKAFGIVGLMAQPAGFPGTPSGVRFEVVGMQRNSKMEFDLKVSLRVYDDKGKPTLVEPIASEFPKDLPEGVDPKKLNVVPVAFPIELTRPGRFRIELEATDRLAKTNKTKTLSYTLNVIDVSGK
jgi:hypothetical protein